MYFAYATLLSVVCQVYRALDMETGAELAIKQVDLHPEQGQNNIKVMLLMVGSVSHNNINVMSLSVVTV